MNTSFQKPIKSPYRLGTGIDARVLLYDGPIRFSVGRESIEIDGQACLALLPTPSFDYNGGTSETVAVQSAIENHLLLARPSKATIPVFKKVPPQPSRRRSFTTKDYSFTTGGHLEEQVVRSARKLDRATFHLVNFRNLTGNEVLQTRRQVWRGRIVFESYPWRIILDARPNLATMVQALNDRGGFGITHVGQVNRLDGAGFTGKQLEDLLDALSVFLSFARGFFVCCLLPIGFDRNAEPCWTAWRMKRIDPWRGTMTWLYSLGAPDLANLFPLFLSKYQDPFWRDVVQHAIHYYLGANLPKPTSTGVTLAQAGMEALAWALRADGVINESRRSFNGKPAAQRMEMLLDYCKIPLDPPRHLRNLIGETPAGSGPARIAHMRNRIIHPDRIGRAFTSAGWFDAWRLSLRYLELSILRVLGYSGSTVNRLKQGWEEEERVPWI